jgi:uncharacterized membrane protein YdjX (TVP38/TMEM64 family)
MIKNPIRYVPVVILVLFIIVFYSTGLHHYISYHFLKLKHDQLTAIVDAHPVSAPAIFMAAYILTMALGIPDILFFTLAGGFLFREPLSFIYVLIAETLGASLFFLSVRLAFGSKFLHKKKFLFFNKMKKEFHGHAASYLLFLRFMHIIPIWMVNIAASLSNVRLWTFMWTSFIGFIPLAYIFTQMGEGLSEIFAKNEKFSIANVLNYKIEISLGLLALLALVPLLIRKYIKKKHGKN